MGKNLIYWISAGVFLILLGIIIISKLFNGFTFFGIVFYILLYIGGYYYVIYGYMKRREEDDAEKTRKGKFEYCWARVNYILKTMAGGQGLQWAKGVGRRSIYKTFYDGVQNKPFRSMIAHLENSQQIVLVIYDIDSDDIASFVTNPSPDYYDNPFLNFKPFTRGMSESPFGMDRRYLGRGYSSYPKRRGGVSINIGDDSESYEEASARLKPEKDTIDSAIDKLR